MNKAASFLFFVEWGKILTDPMTILREEVMGGGVHIVSIRHFVENICSRVTSQLKLFSFSCVFVLEYK